MLRCVLLSVAVVSVSACVTYRPSPIDIVSVRYDPYSYSIAKLQKSAQSACLAKGNKGAFPEPLIEDDPDNPDDDNPRTLRWAYMDFECY